MLQPPPPSAPILPLSLISLALQLTKKPSIPTAGGGGCLWLWLSVVCASFLNLVNGGGRAVGFCGLWERRGLL